MTLVKSGTGTLNLSGNNTFTGGLYLNAGNVILGNAGALNSSTPNIVSFGNSDTTVNGTSNATFSVQSGTLTINGNSLSLPQISTANANAGTPVLQNANAAAAVLTLNGSNASTFNGTIQDGAGGGTLGLTVAGSGGLTLSGSNTYTGPTTIASGKLALASAANNIATSKAITINFGATLDVTKVTSGFSLTLGQTLTGSGSISGTLGATSGSTLNPGSNGVGTLTTTGLTLNSGATLNFEIGAISGDLVNVTGTNGLAINGTGSVLVNLLQPNSLSALATAAGHL